ncbi:hypothetical protein C1646_778041 [Rhizophagus diaphanus]|nr:hypothetical protein C1646_778041 [Rhizophagus diaphanus] [Rhizophagus sp. MUCL 43196]
MPYPYPSFNNSDVHTHSTSSPATSNELPSIEEITVNVIKDLSDEQMQKLGIVKIGWQKNIRQAAQKY